MCERGSTCKANTEPHPLLQAEDGADLEVMRSIRDGLALVQRASSWIPRHEVSSSSSSQTSKSARDNAHRRASAEEAALVAGEVGVAGADGDASGSRGGAVDFRELVLAVKILRSPHMSAKRQVEWTFALLGSEGALNSDVGSMASYSTPLPTLIRALASLACTAEKQRLLAVSVKGAAERYYARLEYDVDAVGGEGGSSGGNVGSGHSSNRPRGARSQRGFGGYAASRVVNLHELRGIMSEEPVRTLLGMRAVTAATGVSTGLDDDDDDISNSNGDEDDDCRDNRALPSLSPALLVHVRRGFKGIPPRAARFLYAWEAAFYHRGVIEQNADMRHRRSAKGHATTKLRKWKELLKHKAFERIADLRYRRRRLRELLVLITTRWKRRNRRASFANWRAKAVALCAARKAQGVCRSYLRRKAVLDILAAHRAACTLQRIYRGHVSFASAAFRLRRRHEAASLIQRSFRGMRGRRAFRKVLVEFHRSRFATLRDKQRQERERVTGWIALKLQAAWRGFLGR